MNMSFDGFDRLERMVGEEAIKTLNQSRVLIFGLGGVGGAATEALARSGVGTLGIVDPDQVETTNLNRQIIALNSTIGLNKVDVMKSRVLDINPQAKVKTYNIFYMAETSHEIPFEEYDFVLDAIDTIASKIHLIKKIEELGVPLVSCMGMGNKWDPTRLEVDDIYNTSVCPLAKVLRKELKSLGVKECKVVYSKETPLKLRPPGSTAFVPPVAGMILASLVVQGILGVINNEG
jgi:tRNA A37 threonylcarbamoyladenosine dehydratase